MAHPLFFIYGKLVTNMPSIASKEIICEFVRAIRGLNKTSHYRAWFIWFFWWPQKHLNPLNPGAADVFIFIRVICAICGLNKTSHYRAGCSDSSDFSEVQIILLILLIQAQPMFFYFHPCHLFHLWFNKNIAHLCLIHPTHLKSK